MNMKASKLTILTLVIFFWFLTLPSFGQAILWPGEGGGSPPATPVLDSINSPTNDVYLTWDSVPSATYYKIYRSESQSGQYEPIGQTTGTSYIDINTETLHGVQWYKIRAYNQVGGSGLSNAESVVVFQKIGVFIWANDSVAPQDQIGNVAWGDELWTHIHDYINIIKTRGFTKIFKFWEPGIDNEDLDDCFDEVRDYELENDAIFFYLLGHGGADYVDNNSVVKLNSRTEENDPEYLWSHDLHFHIQDYESSKIGFFIDSCYAGYFIDDLSFYSYCVITASDEYRPSWTYTLSHERFYSCYFWEAIHNDLNAFQAWYDACSWNNYLWPIWLSFQNAQWEDNLWLQTGYMFFED